MKTKLLLSSLAIIISLHSAISQSIFRKTYTGVTNIASVEPTGDEGYIFCGTDNQNTANTNLSLIKTDARGSVQWAKTYGDGTINETGKKVIKTPEGGFLAIGTAVANYTYPFVVKTNANGDVVWAKYFQSLSSVNPSQTINDVIVMADSGYVFAGASANNYSFFMRVDKDGNVVWTNCHLSTAIIFNRMLHLSNGEFLATGSRGNVFFAAHMNATGDLLSGRTYSAMGTEGLDIIRTDDGNYVFAGKTNNALTMMKTDLAGNVFWAKSYNTTAPFFPSVSELPSGDFLVAVYANSYGPVIMRIDNIGNAPTARYVSGGGNTYADRMKNSHDGNFIHASGTQILKFNQTSAFTCGSTVVAFTATGISPAPVTQTVTYNIVGQQVAPVYYVNSIPVTVTSNCGGKCTSTDNLTVAMNIPDTVCVGRQVSLSYAGVGSVSTYNWTENGVTFSSTASPSRYFNVPGDQSIMLVVTNSANCRDTTKKIIHVRNDCGVTGNPLDYFSKTYTNLTNAADVRPTTDNGFIIAGSTTLPGTPDMCIVKTDSAGVVQWGRAFGSGSLNEYANQVRQTNDGGYLVVGDENYLFAVKTDANGTVVWQNNYQLISGSSGTTSQVVKDIILTPDNGAIIIGSAATNYAMLFKIDSNGNVVWTNHSLGNGITSFNSIAQLSSGNFVITGTSGTTPILLEINQAGTIQWSNQYTVFATSDHVLQLSDGNILICGRYGSNRLSLVKTDPLGNVIWAKYTSISIGTPTGTGAVEDADQGFVVTYYGSSYGLIAMKFNSLGNLVDQRFYTGNINPARVSKTSSGAYVVAESNTLRKFTAFNQIASCNPTVLNSAMTTMAPVRSNINLTPNSYAIANNQFYVSTNTTHTLASPCTNTGCNTIAQFISTPLACTNEVITFTNTSLGGVSYTWNENNVPFDNSINTTRTFSAPGTYVIRLDVVGLTGCNNSYTINIAVGSSFTATVGPDVTIPCGGTTTLSASGGTTYTWSPATGLSDPNIPNPEASPGVTTTYTVSIGNGGNCFINRTVTVTVSGTPVISVTGNNTICSGSSTTLTASGASVYTWQPGNLSGSSVTVSPSVTTTYTVTGTSGSCGGVETFTVTVIPQPVILNSGNITICNGEQTTLTASGALNYSWQPGGLSGASINVSPTTTTNYIVTGTDASGCSGSSGLTVTVNQLPTVIYNELVTNLCDTAAAIILTPATPPGGVYSGPGVTGNQFNPASAGLGTWNIVYTYTDGNGCASSQTQQITVDFCTGVQGIIGEGSISVYPNPFNESITIELPNGTAEVKLVNMLGETAYADFVTNTKSLSTKHLPPGIYFLHIITDSGIITRKLLKQ